MRVSLKRSSHVIVTFISYSDNFWFSIHPVSVCLYSSQHGIVLKWCLKVLNICQSNVGGPGDYHTKWNKSKTNIIWYHLYENLKKMIERTYLWNGNRLTDLPENKPMVTRGKGKWWGIHWESGTRDDVHSDMYTLLCIKWIINRTYWIAQRALLNTL